MNQFEQIKQAYSENMGDVVESCEQGRWTDPYFYNWKFTPIEQWAWNDIRRQKVPFYPQFPIAGFFVDFANPAKKLALEIDGRAFHDSEKDLARDKKLALHGWKVKRFYIEQVKYEQDQPKYRSDSLREFLKGLV